jgi:outer membrane protein assembly factor BamE
MRALPLIIVLALAGCSYLDPANWHAYHMDIQQGNLVTQDAVNKLKVGMSRSQVRFLLGTPLLADSFHANRWDYKYQMYKDDKLVSDKLLTVYFNGDTLAKIEGDAMPAEVPILPTDASGAAAQLPVTASAPEAASAPTGSQP